MTTRNVAVWLGACFLLLTGAAPTAEAPGVGLCVLGSGFDLTIINTSPPYVGANIGTVAPGIFTTQQDFEAACCAETGKPPDCFIPVGE